MSEKVFTGGMVLIGLIAFLIICMSFQSCQVNYGITEYKDVDGDDVFTCCYYNATDFDNYNQICEGAPANATAGLPQRDLLENIKLLSPHIYLILIIVLMGLAVLGTMMMVG